MKMIYGMNDKPKTGKLILFALQQILAIIAATILVPLLVQNATGLKLDQAAALFGAGVGTIVYMLFTRRKSPVFLGSSFAFISPMINAAAFGYLGILFGAIFAGLVYVIVALLIKAIGSKWLDRILPAVVIGPTIAIIGLGLAGSAINNVNHTAVGGYNLLAILVGLVTFFITIIVSVKGGKGLRMIPFIIGIGAGYLFACILTWIGMAVDNSYMQIVNFAPLVDNFKEITFGSFFRVPDFTFIEAFKEFGTFDWSSLGTLALLYAPVAFVVMAEHIGDHKNLSSIIEKDLLKEPGLDNTLLGDGVGSMAGALFGGCPNTTYGESVACVAITKNASIITILCAAIGSMAISFFTPLVALLATLPSCVVGGVCIALYGFIAVSGLKMLQKVDLGDNRNLFVVAAILVPGIGGLSLKFGDPAEPKITITTVAVALILGIVTHFILGRGKTLEEAEAEEVAESGSEENLDAAANEETADVEL